MVMAEKDSKRPQSRETPVRCIYIKMVAHPLKKRVPVKKKMGS